MERVNEKKHVDKLADLSESLTEMTIAGKLNNSLQFLYYLLYIILHAMGSIALVQLCHYNVRNKRRLKYTAGLLY